MKIKFLVLALLISGCGPTKFSQTPEPTPIGA